eukprot:gene7253-5217_t
MTLSEDGKRFVQEGSRVAYCAQRAWILAASVRANVAIAGQQDRGPSANFKKPVGIDEDLYQRALESTLLGHDLQRWPGHDETEIGERGVSISGGQRARLSLARAVYSDSDIFLLDDPLSAVDVHVGKSLMHDCILGHLRARGKAVVLVTHQLQYLSMADEVVVLSKTGEQLFIGSYGDFLSRKDEFQFLELGGQDGDDVVAESEETPIGAASAEAPEAASHEQDAPANEGSDADVERPKDVEQVHVVVESEEDAKRRQIVATEEKKIGDISWRVYWDYLVAGGSGQGLFVLSIILASQALLMITDYWVRWWATSTFGPQSSNQIDVGLIGFALTYTMSLSGLFQWSVRLSAEVESQMTAVERIQSYGELPPEQGYVHGGSLDRHKESLESHDFLHFLGGSRRSGEPSGSKKSEIEVVAVPSALQGGTVDLRDLTVRYRKDLDPVLKDITLHIDAGHKVGICGRTGSGKSSTLLALLRLNLISSGDILVDGMSLLDMDLQTARGKLALIPQDAVLFSGTVRFNLDPFSQHSDEHLWDALADAHFAEHIRSLPNGLDATGSYAHLYLRD